MRIEVNREHCETNGFCAGLVPERLSINAADDLVVSDEPLSDELTRAAQHAVDACPKSALRLIGEPTA
jgi:ferredoxin